MEDKIRLLANYLAAAAGIFCLILIADELLPPVSSHEIILARERTETKDGDLTFVEYYIQTSKGKQLEVSKQMYLSVKDLDKIDLYYTPLFNQQKAIQCVLSNPQMVLKKGEPDSPRDIPLFISIAAVIFSFLCIYVAKRFETKVSLAFFTLIITAVRWWFVGF